MNREYPETSKIILELNDKIIREEYIKYLKTKNDSIILHELKVCDGKARIDLALIDNDKLFGIEIKSELDNLAKLESQKVFYDYTFQTISIIVTKQHLNKIEEFIPKFWEIILAEKQNINELKFTTIRESGFNPHWATKHIAKLLNITEINNILPENNEANLSKKELCLMLQNKYTQKEMTKLVLENFKSDSRKRWLEKSITGYTANFRKTRRKKLRRV